jgi:GcrA cell cycle regulator
MWDDTVIFRLRKLWDEGHSTAEIGRRLGISKNAVVGKAHRLDLPARPSPIRFDGPRAPRPRHRPPAPRLADIAPLASLKAPPKIARAARTTRPPPLLPAIPRKFEANRPIQLGKAPCCWPIGDPGTSGFRFCGDRAVAGKPYCVDHCRIAYTTPRDRREEAA